MNAKFTCTQKVSRGESYKHILDDKTLFIQQGESIVVVEGREQLEELIACIGCRVVAK